MTHRKLYRCTVTVDLAVGQSSDLFCCNVLHQQAKAEDEAAADPAVVAELQREVEDLKLRLHMAAEHYKEKYKECQRLQKQVLKLSEQQGVGPHGYQPTYCIHVPTSERTEFPFVSL